MNDAKLAITQKSEVSNLFWLTFIPLFGSIALVRESNLLSDRKFVQMGWASFAISIILSAGDALFLAWMAQVGIAIWFRSQHLVMPAKPFRPIDFNTCSKDEMVRTLGLPIVYANDIELARTEGFIFTHAEELTEIAGIPEEQVRRIASKIFFTYDEKKDGIDSWRRVNILSAEDFQRLGLSASSAHKLITERENKGDYRSAIDIKRRTGLPLRSYQCLL